MNNVYLKFPNKSDRDEWINYLKEYSGDSQLNDFIYEDWLNKVIKNHNGIDLEEGRVQNSTYFLMKENRIIGKFQIRHNINSPMLKLYGGHIGYGIRPCERRKGYATEGLKLALEKCRELDIYDVLISCKSDNIGSAKTIINNGGKLYEEVFVPNEKAIYNKYIIKIKNL